ncbi:SpoIIE family protein phosphatase [Streptomyces sp. NPDC102441]|uniref:ATP-binding SpoIIE family protein phosphatase n=1 Tax=Streptomyces sp. NPDC102441 TaxID=3366176 RepID=UPI00380AD3EA
MNTVDRRNQALTDALQQLQRLVNPSVATAYLPTAARVLTPAVIADTPLSFTSLADIPIDDPVFYASSRAYQTGLPVAVEKQELAELLRAHPSLIHQVSNDVTVAAVPLLAADQRIFGVLACRWIPAAAWSPSYLDTMARTARHAAAELADIPGIDRPADVGAQPVFTPDQTPAVRQLPTHTDHAFLHQMHWLGSSLVAAGFIADIVRITRRTIAQPVGGTAVLLCAPETGRLRVLGSAEFHRDDSRQIDGTPLTAHSPETLAIQRVLPQHYPTPDALQAAFPGIDRYATAHQSVFLPLIANDRPIGCCVILTNRLAPLHPHELAYMTILAGQVAQCLDRVRSHEAEHALVEEIQRSLLPSAFHTLPGMEFTARYLPADGTSQLGGDWYDIVELPDARLGIVIGDVEGHTPHAVATMAHIVTAMRAYAAEGHTPAGVLTRTNHLLAELHTDLYATCCCLWLDPNRDTAVLANAGHLPPVLITPGHHPATSTMPPDPPLGIHPDITYHDNVRSVPPGTLLALFTNGLLPLRTTDAHTALQRIRHYLSTHVTEHLDALADDLTATARSAGHPDDLALVLLRARGKIGPHDRTAHLTLGSNDLRQVAHVRDCIRRLLPAWRLAPLIDITELLVTEVVTNALIHARTDVDLQLHANPNRIRVEVHDNDPRPPRPAVHLDARITPDDQAESGRGLLIVDVMSSAWGTSPTGRGKTIWFEISVAPH